MRWLHISDIHFGYDSAAVETMRRKILEWAENIEKVDCLFITGDLRYGKQETKAYRWPRPWTAASPASCWPTMTLSPCGRRSGRSFKLR